MGHVGERIRKVREAKSLNQTYVAERLHPPVVPTTLGDIEKRVDLKTARAREIASILEVDEKLLTDEESELDAEDVKPVVRRESLRFFVKQVPLTSREQKQYERILAHKLAPTTVAGWFELRDLIQKFLGHTPGQQPAPERTDVPASAVGAIPVTGEPAAAAKIDAAGRKRMARVPVDRLKRSLRRAG